MPDNWYNLLETQLVATVNSDSWLGTTGTSVRTREARLRPGARAYADIELPAIAIKCIGQTRDDFTFSEVAKYYQFIMFVLDRGGDLDAVINNVQEIVSKAENLLESQHDPANNLQGLGTHADLQGGPVVTIGGGVVDYTQSTEASFTVLCTLEGQVELVMV